MILIAEWLGAVLQIAGAIALAARLAAPRASYAVMLPGGMIWLGIAICLSNWPLAAMQLTFSIINAVGIARWRG